VGVERGKGRGRERGWDRGGEGKEGEGMFDPPAKI